jgi:hypothetical protein
MLLRAPQGGAGWTATGQTGGSCEDGGGTSFHRLHCTRAGPVAGQGRLQDRVCGWEGDGVQGKLAGGELAEVQLCPDGSDALNFAFDVTPARLITALVTERGVCPASEPALAALFPELARASPAPTP